ncbi:MAG: hypothetical protein M3066_05795 [Actinomycetota bacterium]|nr:hypothetical protein [Actinomycetota bacterium]
MAEAGAAVGRTWRGWSCGEAFILAGAVLLIADLILLPWHHYALHVDVSGLGITLPRFSYNRTGVQSPHAVLGELAVIIAALMAVQVVAVKAQPVPALVRLTQLQLVAGPGALALLISKFFSDDAFLGAGAWLALLFGVILAIGGYLRSQDSATVPGPAVGRES